MPDSSESQEFHSDEEIDKHFIFIQKLNSSQNLYMKAEKEVISHALPFYIFMKFWEIYHQKC